ncbi:substrate-binding periplasmic protein [Undibacterium sp. TJN19]|uniref:substrate-binding periplasmic protein n=1 Tax=Undibacterium sp. TJN19 TaxID=3413055 RepID=UPI003BF097C3
MSTLIKYSLSQILFALLTIFMSGLLQAREIKDLPCGSINLAYYEDGNLFYGLGNGMYAGIDKDVIEELGRRSGCQFKTSVESRIRIWTRLSENVLDMSVSGIATPEREKFAHFIPYFATRNYAILHKKLPAAAKTMDGFLADPSLKVAIVKGFRHGTAYDAWLDKLRAQNRVYEVADFNTVTRLFAAHRVAAMLALPTGWLPLQKQKDIWNQMLIRDWSPNDRTVFSLIVSKERVSKAVVDLLEKHVREMREDGSMERLFAQTVGAELAHEMRY